MAIKTVFLTTTGTEQTWTIPSDFGSLVSVEAIGPGYNKAWSSNNVGGGAGAYAYSDAITGLSAGTTVYYRIRSIESTAYGPAYFSTSTGAPSSSTVGVYAEGAAQQYGGRAASCVGTIAYSGGAGGGAGTSGATYARGGGGGSAGPSGAGKNGGQASTSGGTSTDGGGGGGGSNGGASSAGSNGSSTAGGAGGAASDGTSGGSGATSFVNGGNGSNGSGGGGGRQSTRGPGNGSQQDIWTQTSDNAKAGPGGGGGGAGPNGTSGTGGGYGSGGGGVNGTGKQGIIVFTYNTIESTGNFLMVF